MIVCPIKLQANQTIASLDLGRNIISATAIADALKVRFRNTHLFEVNKTITDIDLRDNNFGVGDAKAIANALKVK